MKISTAEIKSLMKECVTREGKYTTADFCDYIKMKSDKRFTSGQIAGAISQLVDTGYLVRVERGLYEGTSAIQKKGETEGAFSMGGKNSGFQRKIMECLENTKRQLTQIAGEENIFKMSEEDYRLACEVKKINDEIEKIIKNDYK